MSNGYEALKSLVRFASLLAAEKASTMANDDVIGVAAILPKWKEGQHAANSVVQHGGQPWRCLQAHDSTGNPTWCPGVAPSLWGTYHSTMLSRALPWVAPTGAHDAYNAGEYMVWTDGATYLCKVNATVHDPEVYPAAWEKVAEPPQPEPEPEPEVDEVPEPEDDGPYIQEGDDSAILPEQ